MHTVLPYFKGDDDKQPIQSGINEDTAPSGLSARQSIHSSDESIPSTSDSRRSLTPAHSSGDQSELNGGKSCLLLQYYYYTTTLLHYSITILLHYYITTLLHYYITTLLHYYITTLLHYYITTLLHYYITTLLHYYIITLLHELLRASNSENVVAEKVADVDQRDETNYGNLTNAVEI